MAEQYWLTLPPVDLGPAIDDRFRKYIEELDRRGRLAKIREATCRYYNEGSAIEFGGEQGEVVLVRVNHFRSLVTTQLSMTTSQRPAYEATAPDDTSQSAAEVQLAQQVLDHELDQGVEVDAVDAAWRMLVQSEATVAVLWDPNGGDEVMPAQPGGVDEMGQPLPEQPAVNAGELVVETYSAYDVARDIGVKSLRKPPWVILRRRMSRWDMLSQYPEAETEILGAKSCFEDDRNIAGATTATLESDSSVSRMNSDIIYVLELYADRSRALPQGAYARVVGARYLEGGPLPYKRIPVVMRSADEVRDRAMGSTPAWDLLSVCEMLDAAESSMASVQDAFGTASVVTAKGQALTADQLAGSLQKLEYQPVPDAKEPHMLQVPRVTSADLEHAQHLQSTAQVLSGVNSLVRGDPDANVKAGVSMAMLQAMAVQHMSRFQAAYAELLREMGRRIIETYQTFAKAPRIIEITGTDEQRTAQDFVGSDIARVRSVRVELGNALTRTIAGKAELADQLLDPTKFPGEPPLTREQFIAVRTTGRHEPITRAPRSASIGLRAECEALVKGEPVMVLVTDNHVTHALEHIALLDGKQRMGLDEQITAGILAHIQEHMSLWQQLTLSNPALLAATGQAPAPMPVMPMVAPPGAPGAPNGPANDNGAEQAPVANDNGGGGPPPAKPPTGAPPIPGTGPSPSALPNMPRTPGGMPVPMPGGTQ